MTIITALSGQPFKNDGGVALNMGDGSTSITNVEHGHTVKSSSYDTNSSFALPNPSGVDPLGVQNDGMVVRKSTKTNIYNNVNNFIFFGAYGSPLFSENKSYAELDAKDIHRSTDTEFSYFPAFTNRQAPLKRKQTIKLGELMMTSGEQLTQTPVEIISSSTKPVMDKSILIQSDDCLDENGQATSQSKDWIILSANPGNLLSPVSISMDVDPPCGCYVDAGLSLIDLIPIGLAFKAIGKVASFFRFILNIKKTASGPWNTAITYVGGKLTEKLPFGDAVATTKGTFQSALEWIKGWRAKFSKFIPNYKTGDVSNLPNIPTIETDIPEDLARVIPHPEKGDTYYTSVVYRGGLPLDEVKNSRYSTTVIKSRYTGQINKFKLFMSRIRSYRETLKKIRDYQTNQRVYLGTYPDPSISPPKVTIKLDPDFFGVDDIGQKYNHSDLPPFEYELVPVAVDVEDTITLAGNVAATPDAIYFDKQTLEGYVTTITNNMSEQYDNYIQGFFGVDHDPGVTSAAWKLKFKAKYGKDIKTGIFQKCNQIYQNQVNNHLTKISTAQKNAKEAISFVKQELSEGQGFIGQIKGEIDAEKQVVLEELKGLANKDKIEATKTLAFNAGWAAPAWLAILGKAIYGVGRQKICVGQNVELNEKTCACECIHDGMSECNADITLNPLWSVPMWTWDNIIPMLPKSEEMTTCYETCCESQVAYKSLVTQFCGCGCYGDLNLALVEPLESGSSESHFKGASGCDCLSKGWTGFGAARGKCVTDTETTTALALEKEWDDARCEYNCAETRHLPDKLGASPDCPDTRLTTNMSGSSYSVFKIGSACECECSQASWNYYNDNSQATWPPTCPAGYVFDTRANVCGCMPAGVCKEYVGDAYGASFNGPNAVSNAIQFINDNTVNCTSRYVHGYYYTSGDYIVAEVVGRLPEVNGEGDQIGYDVITSYTSEGDCGPGAILAGVPEGVLPNVCKTPQITHNYTWTPCPTDGSSCPLTLSDEAFNYTYP